MDPYDYLSTLPPGSIPGRIPGYDYSGGSSSEDPRTVSDASAWLEQQKQSASSAATSDFYNWITRDFRAQMDANRIAQAEQAQIDRDFQLNSAREAMNFSAAEAAKQRNWQQMMSNTAYQRAVQDMRAAGINPILAYTQGGASTPSGAAGTGYAASGSRAEVDTNSLTSLLGSMMTSAASVARGFLSSVGSVGSALVKVLLGV